jgi:hypothetical protein
MRLRALILGLSLLLSMGIGGALHATERVCGDAELSQSVHQDQESSDGDIGEQHAHGCHGHHFATPETAADRSALTLDRDCLSVRSDLQWPDSRAGPELRPPQA